jgi:hypothetical protein
MWALGRSRGRRDTLIIRGVLQRIPGVEFEALDAASWSGREALHRVPTEWPVRKAMTAGDIVVHFSGAEALSQADTLLTKTRRAGLVVKRLSVRRTEPHFQIHISLPDQQQPARDFFEGVRAIAERALD